MSNQIFKCRNTYGRFQEPEQVFLNIYTFMKYSDSNFNKKNCTIDSQDFRYIHGNAKFWF